MFVTENSNGSFFAHQHANKKKITKTPLTGVLFGNYQSKLEVKKQKKDLSKK